ncbi:hypothetical protein IIV31_057L [Armadillidium vulgare iridescent virus]|uniref:KilA-N domain-containing protein n=1 Tax=Armadillidium vulgare iridescent virus TaxID=72201 RepID=A0A068QLP3_9VIRU|nr:hypothetical protein IIV31_057L [Armadillidium vulgare iridescent virus]CCV02429.1 hypothetical protein IIV31_057L [Armadillidium vulgare iridescent virus]
MDENKSLNDVCNETVLLNDICYEHIKDNFYYGLFGDFKLVVDKNTGCFNATKLCNYGGKKFTNWSRLEKSKKLLEHYQSKSWRSFMSASFYEVKLTNNDEINKQITGQYVRKELILDIASWISVEFYDKCNSVILDYFVSQFQTMDKAILEKKIKEIERQLCNTILEKDSIITEKEDKIDELIKLNQLQEEARKEERRKDMEDRKKDREMLRALGVSFEDVKDQNYELLEKVDDQTLKLTTIQNKLEIAVEDRAPQPKRQSKRERFMLIKRNDPDFEYYTIRAQDVSAKTALKRQRALFSEVQILMDIHFHPNSKTLYVRVKEDLKGKGVVFNLCKISLAESKITEEDLVAAMQSINDEKVNV